MENAYGIGINNRYALFIDDEDADPLDILAQASKEKLAVKAKKIEEATKPAPKTVKKEAVTKNDNSGEFCCKCSERHCTVYYAACQQRAANVQLPDFANFLNTIFYCELTEKWQLSTSNLRQAVKEAFLVINKCEHVGSCHAMPALASLLISLIPQL